MKVIDLGENVEVNYFFISLYRERSVFTPPIFLKMNFRYFPNIIVIIRVMNYFIHRGKTSPRGEQ